MSLETGNVRVAVTGGFYYAPAGTALPVDASTPLAVTYKEVGYLTEDGTVMSFGETNTDIKAWQNADVVRRIQTEQIVTLALALMETNTRSLELWTGEAVTTAFEIKAGQLPHQVFMLEIIDGDNTIRVVVPDGQITERGDVTFVNGDAISYPITVTAFPDSTGVKVYGYLDPTAPTLGEMRADNTDTEPVVLTDEQLVAA